MIVGTTVTDVELEVRRNCEIAIVLREGETTVPWELPRTSPLTHLDGTGKATSWFSGLGKTGVHVDQPGRYRIDLPEIAGFQPIPTQIVEARRGETVEHVVQLQRKQ